MLSMAAVAMFCFVTFRPLDSGAASLVNADRSRHKYITSRLLAYEGPIILNPSSVAAVKKVQMNPLQRRGNLR